jgi:SAM-dependent methyltransferase
VFGTAPSDFALGVARLVQPGDFVLDLGCGEGRDSVYFAALGALVFGVDVSGAGLAKARRLARARGVRVCWLRGPMTGLLPSGPFDLIYSCGSMHYVPRHRRADLFARLSAMTRPGGHQAHLVFTDRLVHEEKGEIVELLQRGRATRGVRGLADPQARRSRDQLRTGRDRARPRGGGDRRGAAGGASALAVRDVIA